jgi:hypothetical protein
MDLLYYYPDLANLYTLDESVLIRYFVKELQNTDKEYRDDKKWISKTYKQINKDIPFYSVRQIERIVLALIDRKVLFRELYISVMSYSFTDRFYQFFMSDHLQEDVIGVRN